MRRWMLQAHGIAPILWLMLLAASASAIPMVEIDRVAICKVESQVGSIFGIACDIMTIKRQGVS